MIYIEILLKMVDGIFKGARHAIRNQFRQSADEVQTDKEHNWTQMMTLEAMIGKEIEEQKRLNKELDAIIAILEQKKNDKKNGSKKNSICDFLTITLIIAILVGLVAVVLFKRFSNI